MSEPWNSHLSKNRSERRFIRQTNTQFHFPFQRRIDWTQTQHRPGSKVLLKGNTKLGTMDRPGLSSSRRGSKSLGPNRRIDGSLGTFGRLETRLEVECRTSTTHACSHTTGSLVASTSKMARVHSTTGTELDGSGGTPSAPVQEKKLSSRIPRSLLCRRSLECASCDFECERRRAHLQREVQRNDRDETWLERGVTDATRRWNVQPCTTWKAEEWWNLPRGCVPTLFRRGFGSRRCHPNAHHAFVWLATEERTRAGSTRFRSHRVVWLNRRPSLSRTGRGIAFAV